MEGVGGNNDLILFNFLIKCEIEILVGEEGCWRFKERGYV